MLTRISDIQLLIAHVELTIHEAGEGESVLWQEEIRVFGYLSAVQPCCRL